MRKHLFISLATILLLSGCATVQQADPLYQQQKKKLALAQMLIEGNKIPAAKEVLSSISKESKIKGITDEALFRLALLNLETGEHKIATGKSGENLDKLLNDYPSSPWRNHAATLKGLMDSYDVALEERNGLEQSVRSLRNSYSSLKSMNLSLSRENKELRQGIEKLKNLDLELEMKNKK
ncbi:MAG: tetratricopeptide repeat protein [Geobacteraceae bacterium]|nr:tetratricopeptide repeat protein [Geobacteraceae bacterium]